MPQISYNTAIVLGIAFLIVGGIVLLADLVILFVWLKSRARVAEGGEPIFAPKWSLVDVFVGGQIIFALALMAQAPFMALPFVLHKNITPDDALKAAIIPATIAQEIITAGVVFLYVKLRYQESVKQFFFGERPWRGALIGVAVGVPLIAAMLAIQDVSWLKSLDHALGHTEIGRILRELQKVMDATWLVMQLVKTRAGFVGALLAVGIAAPVAEEVFFRGFLFNALRQRFGVTAGIVLSSLIFASFHLQIIYLALMFIMAMVMAILYQRTRTLMAPIAVHVLNNSVVVCLAYFAPNLVK